MSAIERRMVRPVGKSRCIFRIIPQSSCFFPENKLSSSVIRPTSMHKHARTSTSVLVALAALAGAVTGVFAFSSGIEANTELTYVRVAALPKAEPLVLGSQDEEDEAPAVISHLTLARYTVSKRLMPIADAARRVTKKPFGIEIHPETSPVPNDKF